MPPYVPVQRVERTCELPECSVTFTTTARSIRRFCCHEHGKRMRLGTPCSVCGALVYGTRGEPPPAKGRTCNPCRRARRPAKRPLVERTCATDRCGVVFMQHHWNQAYCTRACRNRTRWRRADQRQARDPRYGHRYRQLRARVAAEEPSCWRCGHLIDPARVWPDRWSFSLDHVRPIAHGGDALGRDNVRAAHLGCNVQAGREVSARRPRRAA